MPTIRRADQDLRAEWVHLAYEDRASFSDVYGFAGNQGNVNLEGILYRPANGRAKTLFVFMHPASTLQLLPVPRELAMRGAHVLCAASRYARNDTALIMEKVLLDLGAYIRHARKVWGYKEVVLIGWSGGGSLALFYQSQAEAPSITCTPAGDPCDLVGAGLIPADAVVIHAAHIGRAYMLAELIDPSVRNEFDPEDLDDELDIYSPTNPERPPFSAPFLRRYRVAQRERIRRITADVKRTLERLKQRRTGEVERGILVHRTFADPRFIDPAIDPNDRRPNWCYMGLPETVNGGPAGVARYSTLRAWLSQWSFEDSNADGLRCAERMRAPMLAIENTADDVVPQPHTHLILAAAGSTDKSMHVIKGATHYYAGQPELLDDAVTTTLDWLAKRGLARN